VKVITFSHSSTLLVVLARLLQIQKAEQFGRMEPNGVAYLFAVFRRSVTSLWNAKVLSWCAVVGSPSMTDGLMVTLL
jgi:hypothetical protein